MLGIFPQESAPLLNILHLYNNQSKLLVCLLMPSRKADEESLFAHYMASVGLLWQLVVLLCPQDHHRYPCHVMWLKNATQQQYQNRPYDYTS